ncbi:MAG: S-layer homology domain-containing protein [Syntrophomonadaceae bacterium]|nr:S-layer homology domain-containing protein [Syntrophomonadaceae bacterium]MDD3888612.1 S-layer homology domain-containing protein [Syntrophomonadaceae bacterium]MDD4549171.1 S-layer homology domain-containing protein [Syntrophomonadaceae bacterium]
MKRLVFIAILTLGLFSCPLVAGAIPPDFAGGVNDEYQYEEVVFLSGNPIKFVGTFSISEKDRDNEKSISYKFKLAPEDSSIEGKLDRKVTYQIQYDRYNDKGQTVAQGEVKTYRETINIGEDRYSLSDYQFSKSDIIDNRPAADFYSGTLKARKYYDINKDEGTAIVEISGGSAGYENFWGSTETMVLDYIIDVEKLIPPEDDEEEAATNNWQGTVKTIVSDSMSKTLKYSGNEANYSSFAGGHMRISNREMYSQYEYNLPRVTGSTANNNKRDRGKVELNRKMLPQIERLIVPKFRDIGGHWAEEDIKKLYSLDVFAGNMQFFAPDVPMTRMDFIRAVMKASDIRVLQEETRKSRIRRNKVAEVSPFKDVRVDNPDYKYIKEALNRGIVSGVAGDYFKPGDKLTRAQAITILIRALGFESKAPTPGYFTSFSDDYNIPDWARDSVYMAQEIGLIRGDAANRINPEHVMTRAEASVMLVRFLNFLETDLQKDYREDIILYN